MIAPSGKIFFTSINKFFLLKDIHNGKKDVSLVFAQRMPALVWGKKSLKKYSLEEEENIMYMSKIISHSFTICAKKGSVFGCSNYLYWVSCLVIFPRRTRKNKAVLYINLRLETGRITN